MKKVFLFIGALFFAYLVQAQDIFKEHGFTKEPLTLSKGKYDEIFTNKEIVQIGTVLLNTKTNKIVEFLDEETDDISFVAEHSSRWLSPDPLATMYYSVSPYVFCLNNPINAIDPDGKIVIFINGYHWGSKGGSPRYWKEGDKKFDKAVMQHLKDSNPLYRDGSLSGIFGLLRSNTSLSPLYRGFYGFAQGRKDAAEIIKRISDNDGNIIETIKIITHSMGAAYAKGYILALLEYFKANNIPSDIIEFEADFAPFQPDEQMAISGVPTYQYSHNNDGVAGNKRMIGAEYMDTSSDEKQGHSLMDYIDQINNLPAGTYKIEDGKLVPIKNRK